MIKITRNYREGVDDFQGGAAFADFGTVVEPKAPAAGTPPPIAPLATPPTTPTPEEQVADQALIDQLMEKEEAELTTEEKTKLDQLKTKYEVQEVGEDGKVIDKAAEEAKVKKIADIKAKAEGQRTVEEVKFLADNEEKKPNVYEEVDLIAGNDLAVDYGTIDPLSVEGIVKRETAIRELTEKQVLAQIKQEYPIGYQFLLHQQAGGSIESFLAVDTEDYQNITLVKEDKATQEKIYRRALSMKGISSDQVEALVTIAKDKNKLYDESSKELVALQKNQAIEEKRKEAQVRQREQLDNQASQNFYTQLNTYLEKGFNGMLIPVKDRKAFGEFVAENTRVFNGQLIYTTNLDEKNLEQELAASYFKYKKGDLSGVVQRKAASLIADQKRKAIKFKLVPRSSAPTKLESVPMSEI
jgi:hypothetical protein